MTITEDIWNVLRTDLAIQKDLEKGLINHRALARYILDTYPIKASMESAISAIRRFKSEEIFEKTEKVLLGMFKDALISTRSNMACLTLAKEAEKRLPGLLEKRPDQIRITTGSKNLKLMFDKALLGEIKKAFSRKDIVKVESDLAELSVTMSEEIIKTKGVLARISDEIALHNINIMEMIVCPPEFLIYVRQEDIIKTYESLLKLRKKGI